MNKNTFEGSTNPIERNDQDESDPAAQPNPGVLATLVQEAPIGSGDVAVAAEHDTSADDVLVDEQIPSNLLPLDVPGTNLASSVSLIGPDESEHLRTRWNEVQGKFVDEPRSAVQEADALVSNVIEKIAQIFANERGALEEQWKDGKDVSTEDLRKALQQYRSFFNRLVV